MARTSDILDASGSNRTIYFFRNAASLLAGSAGASAPYRLDKVNSNPTYFVTDGTYFWIVDDGKSAGNVFNMPALAAPFLEVGRSPAAATAFI
jgi:hypothetical protein